MGNTASKLGMQSRSPSACPICSSASIESVGFSKDVCACQRCGTPLARKSDPAALSGGGSSRGGYEAVGRDCKGVGNNDLEYHHSRAEARLVNTITLKTSAPRWLLEKLSLRKPRGAASVTVAPSLLRSTAWSTTSLLGHDMVGSSSPGSRTEEAVTSPLDLYEELGGLRPIGLSPGFHTTAVSRPRGAAAPGIHYTAYHPGLAVPSPGTQSLASLLGGDEPSLLGGEVREEPEALGVAAVQYPDEESDEHVAGLAASWNRISTPGEVPASTPSSYPWITPVTVLPERRVEEKGKVSRYLKDVFGRVKSQLGMSFDSRRHRHLLSHRRHHRRSTSSSSQDNDRPTSSVAGYVFVSPFSSETTLAMNHDNDSHSQATYLHEAEGRRAYGLPIPDIVISPPPAPHTAEEKAALQPVCPLLVDHATKLSPRGTWGSPVLQAWERAQRVDYAFDHQASPASSCYSLSAAAEPDRPYSLIVPDDRDGTDWWTGSCLGPWL